MFNNFYKGKKVIITGHTGFKGSWMSIWLKQLGAEVYGYALEPLSKEDNFNICGVDKIVHHKVGDVRILSDLSEYFLKVKPDIAFHLAAQPLVLRSYQNPVETFETNLMGVVNFFEAVRGCDSVKSAVNITSDKCYDNKEWIWGYRENDPMGGKDPYSASKGCSELITSSYLNSFFSERSMQAIGSARAGNVIGGGDWAENRIVPDFFRAVADGRSLDVRNPFSTRPWQFVLEPISGYLSLGMSLHSDKGFSGAWNFGPNPENNNDVKTLIESIIQYGGRGKSHYSENQNSSHEAKILKLDISKASTLLQWKPVLNFNETIVYTVDGYLDQINKKNVMRSRLDQINAYAKKANDLKINWAN